MAHTVTTSAPCAISLLEALWTSSSNFAFATTQRVSCTLSRSVGADDHTDSSNADSSDAVLDLPAVNEGPLHYNVSSDLGEVRVCFANGNESGTTAGRIALVCIRTCLQFAIDTSIANTGASLAARLHKTVITIYHDHGSEASYGPETNLSYNAGSTYAAITTTLVATILIHLQVISTFDQIAVDMVKSVTRTILGQFTGTLSDIELEASTQGGSSIRRAPSSGSIIPFHLPGTTLTLASVDRETQSVIDQRALNDETRPSSQGMSTALDILQTNFVDALQALQSLSRESPDAYQAAINLVSSVSSCQWVLCADMFPSHEQAVVLKFERVRRLSSAIWGCLNSFYNPSNGEVEGRLVDEFLGLRGVLAAGIMRGTNIMWILACNTPSTSYNLSPLLLLRSRLMMRSDIPLRHLLDLPSDLPGVRLDTYVA